MAELRFTLAELRRHQKHWHYEWPGGSEQSFARDPTFAVVEQRALPPAIDTQRYPAEHIAGRLREIDGIIGTLRPLSVEVDERIDGLLGLIGGHLFLPPHIENSARASLADAARTLQQLIARAEGLRGAWLRVPAKTGEEASDGADRGAGRTGGRRRVRPPADRIGR